MAFVLTLTDGADTGFTHGGTPYENGDSFEFLHEGVLKIVETDGRTTYYAPGSWHSVETTNDQEPTH